MRALKIIIILLLCCTASQAQDSTGIYSITHRKQFVRWLITRGEFRLARMEMLQLLSWDPANDSLAAGFIYTSRQSSTFSFIEPAGPLSRYQHTCMLLQTDSIDLARRSIAYMTNNEERLTLLLTASLLDKNYKRASSEADSLRNISMLDLRYLVTKGQQLPHKSPWLAGSMSAIIPGSGKLYTREYEDGLYSMISIGLLAWQSIRAFKQEGIRSPLGWVSGSIGLTFYSANIYGSAKSARRFNRKQWEQYRHEIHHDLLGVLHQ